MLLLKPFDFQWKTSSCLFNIILPQKKLRSMILYLYICMAWHSSLNESEKRLEHMFFLNIYLIHTFFSHKMNSISIQSFNSSHFKQKCTNAEKKSSVLFVLMYEYIKYGKNMYNSEKNILNVNLSRKANDKFKPFVITTWHLAAFIHNIFIVVRSIKHIHRRWWL